MLKKQNRLALSQQPQHAPAPSPVDPMPVSSRRPIIVLNSCSRGVPLGAACKVGGRAGHTRHGADSRGAECLEQA